ncbi:MAG: response regulator, partial [Candidatus Omnitrophica bacterium]|nr:response regulator [Candidatus Omnitrophota bacterium]
MNEDSALRMTVSTSEKERLITETHLPNGKTLTEALAAVLAECGIFELIEGISKQETTTTPKPATHTANGERVVEREQIEGTRTTGGSYRERGLVDYVFILSLISVTVVSVALYSFDWSWLGRVTGQASQLKPAHLLTGISVLGMGIMLAMARLPEDRIDPASSAHTPQPIPAAKPDARRLQLRVLIVDDDPWDLKTMEYLLKDRPGIDEIVMADDGSVALAKFKEKPFDLVFTDYEMPKMDGATLIRELKAIALTLPIVFLSNWPQERLIQRLKETGLSAAQLTEIRFLLKGFTFDEFRGFVDNLIKDVQGQVLIEYQLLLPILPIILVFSGFILILKSIPQALEKAFKAAKTFIGEVRSLLGGVFGNWRGSLAKAVLLGLILTSANTLYAGTGVEVIQEPNKLFLGLLIAGFGLVAGMASFKGGGFSEELLWIKGATVHHPEFGVGKIEKGEKEAGKGRMGVCFGLEQRFTLSTTYLTRLLTVNELAKAVNVKPEIVFKEIEAGRLKANYTEYQDERPIFYFSLQRLPKILAQLNPAAAGFLSITQLIRKARTSFDTLHKAINEGSLKPDRTIERDAHILYYFKPSRLYELCLQFNPAAVGFISESQLARKAKVASITITRAIKERIITPDRTLKQGKQHLYFFDPKRILQIQLLLNPKAAGYLSPAQLAQKLGLGIAVVLRAIKEERFKADAVIKRGKKSYYYFKPSRLSAIRHIFYGLLSVKALAKKIDVPAPTIYSATATKRLKPDKIVGKNYYFKPSRVDEITALFHHPELKGLVSAMKMAELAKINYFHLLRTVERGFIEADKTVAHEKITRYYFKSSRVDEIRTQMGFITSQELARKIGVSGTTI